MIASFLVIVINTFFAGHLGDEKQLAAVGMASMYVNILCNSLILGLNSTLSTLLAQAKGFDNYQLIGVYLNRGRIAMTLLFAFLMVFFL